MYVMRTVSVFALVVLVLFVLGGRMNTSAGRADWNATGLTAREGTTQSLANAAANPVHESANNAEAHPTLWLTKFEPLLLLLLGSVLLAVSTGIRLVLARR
jgi:hypothetical protein